MPERPPKFEVGPEPEKTIHVGPFCASCDKTAGCKLLSVFGPDGKIIETQLQVVIQMGLSEICPKITVNRE